MTQQWLAAASKCVRRGIRANAAARVNAASAASIAPKQANVAQRWTRAFSSTPHPSETFLTGTNNAYVEEMYDSWKSNPQRYAAVCSPSMCCQLR